ncbi:hypothetical protein AMATHDRAFT_48953 [Amanita thiersii Skay4041]|uniref:G-protein coupled receptors family 1 profile domain-containing protein n=1 Tax=Amanita thiersii Skay4041 TaxID=703135 RepID=A0A2A9NGC7_9AGAR|nr:hypothetical protein AMATHDRAFT_48953 [Amanita thiersii Skay4041]
MDVLTSTYASSPIGWDVVLSGLQRRENVIYVDGDFGPSLSFNNCNMIIAALTYMYVVSCYVAEAILAYRVWAVWGRNQRLTYGLPVMFAILVSASLVNIHSFLHSLELAALPAGHKIRGCLIKDGANLGNLSYSWICFMVYDTTLFFLLLVQGTRTYRRNKESGLIKTVYRDGDNTQLTYSHALC